MPGTKKDERGEGPEKREISPEVARSVADRLRLSEAMKRITHKLVVMSGKGGVGKSTVAANLACVLAKNAKVGLLDADITGPDIPMVMGVEGAAPRVVENRIEPIEGPLGIRIISMGHILPAREAPVIWRGPLKMMALRQFLADVNWGDLDFLIIDLPPGTSDEPLSIAQDIPEAEGAIIVTTPQQLSLLDVYKSISFAKAVKLPVLGILENMSGYTCPECGHHEDLFKSGGGEESRGGTRHPVPRERPNRPEHRHRRRFRQTVRPRSCRLPRHESFRGGRGEHQDAGREVQAQGEVQARRDMSPSHPLPDQRVQLRLRDRADDPINQLPVLEK